MEVWVVMGNDYPDAVFSTNAKAQEYCAQRRRINDKNMKDGRSRKIYYHIHDFILDYIPT